jgi:hypothetical protein
MTLELEGWTPIRIEWDGDSPVARYEGDGLRELCAGRAGKGHRASHGRGQGVLHDRELNGSSRRESPHVQIRQRAGDRNRRVGHPDGRGGVARESMKVVSAGSMKSTDPLTIEEPGGAASGLPEVDLAVVATATTGRSLPKHLAHSRAISLVTVGGMPKAATPWGQTEVVEELTVPQRAGEKRFATIVQLLADGKGEELVRFAYSTGGTARRGPVTLRATRPRAAPGFSRRASRPGSGSRDRERASVRNTERSLQPGAGRLRAGVEPFARRVDE